MDFSFEKISGKNLRIHDSGKDSPLQLIFIPGPYNPKIWRHQIKYFSENYRTICFTPESGNSYEEHREALEAVLEEKDLSDAVLVSSCLGNSLSQEFEYNEKVVGTVLTGVIRKLGLRLPKKLYSVLETVSRHPKLAKKIFFSRKTDYSVVEEFVHEVGAPDYEDYRSFRDAYSIRTPVKNCLMVHASDDRLSSIKDARKYREEASVSVIRNAGSFSFYEKPQEYNKALHDFLDRIGSFVESREVSRAKDQNRTLEEFSAKNNKVRG